MCTCFLYGLAGTCFNVFVFIAAWSTTKIPILTFEAISLGIDFTITRLILSVIGILIIAGATEKWLNHEQQERYMKSINREVIL